MRALVAALLTCLLPGLCGCGDEGRLLITLEQPKEKTFDPMQDVRLSRFNLRITRGSSQSDQETVRTENTVLRVGSVPVGEPFDLRLAGKSSTGQMLGLGLLFDLNVAGEGETVAVKFRKPIGFVAGNLGIDQLDTTASTGSNIHLKDRIAAPNAVDVAASPDGTWIAVLSGARLSAFLTYDGRNWADLTLASPGTCLAVSPDSHYAVICHDDGTVSIVDMELLAEKQRDVRTVNVGTKPTRVVFGRNRDLAQVLVNGAGYTDGCSAQSKLVEVNVDRAVKGKELGLGGPVADLAVDPRDGRVLLAVPCKSQLARVNGNQVEKALDLPGGVYDLALTDQYIVAVGTRAGTDNTLNGETVQVDLNKQGFSAQRKPFFLPGLAVWWVPQSGGEGNIGWSLDTQDHTTYDVTVSPDGQRALALFRATYASNMVDNGCSYQASMVAHGLLLLDLTVDRVVYSHYTKLDISKCSTCQNPSCAGVMRTALQNGGALSQPEYTPKGTAMLFGGP